VRAARGTGGGVRAGRTASTRVGVGGQRGSLDAGCWTLWTKTKTKNRLFVLYVSCISIRAVSARILRGASMAYTTIHTHARALITDYTTLTIYNITTYYDYVRPMSRCLCLCSIICTHVTRARAPDDEISIPRETPPHTQDSCQDSAGTAPSGTPPPAQPPPPAQTQRNTVPQRVNPTQTAYARPPKVGPGPGSALRHVDAGPSTKRPDARIVPNGTPAKSAPQRSPSQMLRCHPPRRAGVSLPLHPRR